MSTACSTFLTGLRSPIHLPSGLKSRACYMTVCVLWTGQGWFPRSVLGFHASQPGLKYFSLNYVRPGIPNTSAAPRFLHSSDLAARWKSKCIDACRLTKSVQPPDNPAVASSPTTFFMHHTKRNRYASVSRQKSLRHHVCKTCVLQLASATV